MRSSVLLSATITAPRLAKPCRTWPCRSRPHLLSEESSREPFQAQCCCLQLLPFLAAPHLGTPCPASSTLSKRAAERACALRAAVCNCYLARPGLAYPCPTPLSFAASTLRREQQGEPKLSVLPSATVAVTDPTGPQLAMPNSGGPSPTGAYTKGCPV